jgi:hypothetical protein
MKINLNIRYLYLEMKMKKKNKSHLYGKCVYFPFRNNGKPIFYEVFFLQIDEYIYNIAIVLTMSFVKFD